ncbi:MAG: hypothetical protein LUI13_10665 [Lachnospiraceae bacterium]|nr:hypothetical protein [Lachnospiraceae bacterium]
MDVNCKTLESSVLSESKLMEVDANNRKAKAILSALVHATELSDMDEMEITELIQAAYDWIWLRVCMPYFYGCWAATADFASGYRRRK